MRLLRFVWAVQYGGEEHRASPPDIWIFSWFPNLPRASALLRFVTTDCIVAMSYEGTTIINTCRPRGLVLVREFESRRGEILNLFAKMKKGSTAESA